MDALQELPVDQWPLLLQKLQTLWPLNMGAYYTVDHHLRFPLFRDAFQYKLYCPNGDIDNGFISICKKGDRNCIMISSISKDTSKLEDALLSTKLIDWNRRVNIDMGTSLVKKLMREKIKPVLEFKEFDAWDASMYYLDKSAKPFEDVKCPPEVYLGPVKQEHIKQVDDAWPHKYAASYFLFSSLASSGLSYGLYSREDNKLVAWIFLSEFSNFNHLFCEECHRRKGYAELLLKIAANDKLSKGDGGYAYVAPENKASQALFLKLGFKWVDDGAWITVSK